MEDHGGEITLADAEKRGGGAGHLTFPFAQKNPKGQKEELKMSKNGSLIASEILIVDDEEDIRDLISGILHDEGYTTRVAGDCESALAAIRARRPQLVVLDIWLQGSKLDGIEVLDTIKREQADLPVVMISGHGTIETAVASIKKGAYDFVEKPFKADRLLHGGGARAGSRAPAPRSAGTQAEGGRRGRVGGQLPHHHPAAGPDRQDRAHQQPRADRRSRRLGQGSGGAADPCPIAPRRQCLCRHQLPRRKANTTKLFLTPPSWPNAITADPDGRGFWVQEQKHDSTPETAWLLDMKGKVLKSVVTQCVDCSGMAVGNGFVWSGANGASVHNPTNPPTEGVFQTDMNGKTIGHRQIPFGPKDNGGSCHGLAWDSAEGGRLWI